jgi:hypothetical protein
MSLYQKVRWIDEGHRLGLIFSDGVQWIRCLTIEKLTYRSWMYGFNLLAAVTGSQTSVEVKDSAAQRLLEVPEAYKQKMLLQYALGVNPPGLRVYPEFPSGHKIGRVPGIDPIAVGNEYGFKTGEDSPFMEPSDALEFFSIYGFSPIFNFYNPHETKKAQPVFSIHMVKANIEILDPRNPVDADLIGKMARGIIPTRLVSMGPVEEPASWKSIDGWPNPITMEESKKLYKGK